MSEQVGSAAASGFIAVLLALLGVQPLALLWASIGAAAALVFSRTRPGWHEMLTVLTSALIGAAVGHWLVEVLEGGRQGLIVFSLVCGAGCKPILNAGIERATNVIGGRQ